jgi:hypothetical protein
VNCATPGAQQLLERVYLLLYGKSRHVKKRRDCWRNVSDRRRVPGNDHNITSNVNDKTYKLLDHFREAVALQASPWLDFCMLDSQTFRQTRRERSWLANAVIFVGRGNHHIALQRHMHLRIGLYLNCTYNCFRCSWQR